MRIITLFSVSIIFIGMMELTACSPIDSVRPFDEAQAAKMFPGKTAMPANGAG